MIDRRLIERWIAWLRVGGVLFAILEVGAFSPGRPSGYETPQWTLTGVFAVGSLVLLYASRNVGDLRLESLFRTVRNRRRAGLAAEAELRACAAVTGAQSFGGPGKGRVRLQKPGRGAKNFSPAGGASWLDKISAGGAARLKKRLQDKYRCHPVYRLRALLDA